MGSPQEPLFFNRRTKALSETKPSPPSFVDVARYVIDVIYSSGMKKARIA